MIALSLGLRRGEILGLSWNDIEATEGTVVLHVRRQLIRDKSGVQLVDLKTVGSRRVLHLSRPVVEVLERHRMRQEAEELVVGKRWDNEHELIFTSNIGTPLDPEEFGRDRSQDLQGSRSGPLVDPRTASLLRLAPHRHGGPSGGRRRTARPRIDSCHEGRLRAPHAALAGQGRRSDANDLCTTSPRSTPETSIALATSLATLEPERLNFNPLTRTLVGRPGLDPGTLGLKVPCSSR